MVSNIGRFQYIKYNSVSGFKVSDIILTQHNISDEVDIADIDD